MSQETNLSKKNLEDLPICGIKARNEKEEKFLKEIQEYEFFNLEQQGMSLKFPYGTTNCFMNFHLFHGGKYKLPRHVARHLESRTTPLYDWRPDGQGRMIKQKIGEKSRFQMRPVYS